MAEFAASVVGLIGTVKTCIDLWTIVTTTTHVNRDLDNLVAHLCTEKIRFLLWCQITEMHDLAEQVEGRGNEALKRGFLSGRSSPLPPDSLSRWGNLLLRPDTPDFLRAHFERIMVRMLSTLRELEGMLRSYGFLAPPEASFAAKVRSARSKATTAWFRGGHGSESVVGVTGTKPTGLDAEVPRSTNTVVMPLREVQQLATTSRSADLSPSATIAEPSTADDQPAQGMTPSVATTRPQTSSPGLLKSINRGLKWTFQGKQAMMEQITELRQYNNDLKDILDTLDRPRGSRLQRWFETAVTATPIADAMSEKQSLHPTTLPTDLQEKWRRAESSRREQKVAALTRAAKRRAALQAWLDVESDVDPLNGAQFLQDQGSGGSPTDVTRNQPGPEALLTQDNFLGLSAKDVRITEFHASEVVERSRGHYGATPVVIEWRHYSSRLSREGQNLVQIRVRALASMLKNCSYIPDFHILECRGFFYMGNLNRYGLVYDHPRRALNPTTMRDKLVDDFKNKTRHDLESRLRLAATLARIVYQFFALGWVHKNIRSASVLFFETEPSGTDRNRGEGRRPVDLSRPFLAGFGLSRQGNGVGTEDMPSTLKSSTEQKEWQLYIHPQRRVDLGLVLALTATTDTTNTTAGATSAAATPSAATIEIPVQVPIPNPANAPPTETTESSNNNDDLTTISTKPNRTRSNLLYDSYSLGMMLLEIALWCPLVKLCSRSSTVDEFQASVLDTFEEKIRFNMGRRYADVVRWCLTNWEAVEQRPSSSVRGAAVVVTADVQLFLEVFESVVLTELDALVID